MRFQICCHVHGASADGQIAARRGICGDTSGELGKWAEKPLQTYSKGACM